MQIERGITVNANWTRTILIGDGARWYSRLRGEDVNKIGGIFIASPASTYEFDTITKIRIELSNGSSIDIEAQNVGNQPTWNLGTQASLDAAIGDLNTWVV